MDQSLIWRDISALHRQLQRYLGRVMQPLGITASEYTFVVSLCKLGAASQRELSQELSVDEALTVRAMKSLEEKGIVKRRRSESDKRQYEVTLTKRGESVRPAILGAVDRWGGALLGSFSQEQVDLLCRMLEEMCAQTEDAIQNT